MLHCNTTYGNFCTDGMEHHQDAQAVLMGDHNCKWQMQWVMNQLLVIYLCTRLCTHKVLSPGPPLACNLPRTMQPQSNCSLTITVTKLNHSFIHSVVCCLSQLNTPWRKPVYVHTRLVPSHSTHTACF